MREILSRLGADSREEAAEYWRAYNGLGRKFERVFRGLTADSSARLLVTAVGGAAAVVAAGGTILLLVVLQAAPTPPTTPVEGTAVSLFGAHPLLHMVDAKNGWALEGSSGLPPATSGPGARVLRTTDGGRNWSDVTPPGARAATVAAGDFARADHAWVATIRGQDVTLSSTDDGGATWPSEPVSLPSGTSPVDGLSLSFSDLQDGWLLVSPQHGMNSSPAILLRTTDGGRHWSLVSQTTGAPNALPFAGQIRFEGTEGWIVGAKVSTINRSLFVSRDGGRTWAELSLAIPAGLPPGGLDPSAPPIIFSTGTNSSSPTNDASTTGVLAATFVPESHLAVEFKTLVYTTTIGQAAVPVPYGGPWSFISAREWWVWSAEPRDTGSSGPVHGKLYRTNDGGRSWEQLTADATLERLLQSGKDIGQLDFVSPQRGWALVQSSDGRLTDLLTTGDGGRGWSSLASVP